jgi:hypothetical protein
LLSKVGIILFSDDVLVLLEMTNAAFMPVAGVAGLMRCIAV